MIHSFASKDIEKLWQEGKAIRWKNIERQAMKKMAMLAAAQKLEDMRVPPGNRLEALKAIGQDNTASASTTNGGFAFAGVNPVPLTQK
jgi:plasmid maintenance system killer protein